MRITPVATFVVLLLVSVQTGAQDSYWQQQLKYVINVALDDTDHSLTGKLQLKYRNNSPDTLSYIWFHIWPNAFKNDKTAFSEERLRNGKTDFYFSNENERGYINQLDFRSGDVSLEVEDDPVHIDIIKVLLPAPLLPGEEIELTTPFHVQLPFNFSGLGHNDGFNNISGQKARGQNTTRVNGTGGNGSGGQSYQLSNFYPKPAVYDNEGWHTMPYLETGGSYDEPGDYDVAITLPRNYVVAATGALQDLDELAWLRAHTTSAQRKKITPPKTKNSFGKPKARFEEITSEKETKTLHYLQTGIRGFSIFADKNFGVRNTIIALPSGNTVEAWAFYRSAKPCCELTPELESIKFNLLRSPGLTGEYPYGFINFIETANGAAGSASGSGFISIDPKLRLNDRDSLILHQFNRMVFSSLISVNERKSAWLTLGSTEYFDEQHSSGNRSAMADPLYSRSIQKNLLAKSELQKTDQALNTPADQFTPANQRLVAGIKGAEWLQAVEAKMGNENFRAAIREYAVQWQHKHPVPADLFNLLKKHSAEDLSGLIAAIDTTGDLHIQGEGKKGQHYLQRGLKPELFYLPEKWDSIRRIYIAPALGYNTSDGLMAGLLVHNYALPYSRFRYFVSPLYGVRSGEINGIADLAYSIFPGTAIKSIRLGAGFAKFSTLSAKDSNGSRISAGFMRLSPSIRVTFNNRSFLSTTEKWIEWKTFLISESGFEYKEKLSDGQFYPEKSATRNRYLNQLTFNVNDSRVLYPYHASLQVQQARDFYRVNLNADYFFNYPVGGGLNIRFFAAKFGYIGERTVTKQFMTQAYQPKLTAVRGSEDYTYGNYFIGRNENNGLASQQIMLRDGGLKIRTDLFQDLQGRSDNWVSSINLNTTIPPSILPKQIPLRLFFDIGTYANAWDKRSNATRFLYVGGIQLSLFSNFLNVYVPVIYSKDFSNSLKTVPEENKFLRKISFSIDVHRLNYRKSPYLNALF